MNVLWIGVDRVEERRIVRRDIGDRHHATVHGDAAVGNGIRAGGVGVVRRQRELLALYLGAKLDGVVADGSAHRVAQLDLDLLLIEQKPRGSDCRGRGEAAGGDDVHLRHRKRGRAWRIIVVIRRDLGRRGIRPAAPIAFVAERREKGDAILRLVGLARHDTAALAHQTDGAVGEVERRRLSRVPLLVEAAKEPERRSVAVPCSGSKARIAECISDR